MKNNLVTQKNELVEAHHIDPLSVSEQKVVLTMISMIEPSDDDWKTYQLSVQDFAEMVGLKGKSPYSELKKISKTLVSKVIEIPIGKKDWLVATWASSVMYKSDEGMIEFSFDAKLKPYLLQLKNQFTSYRLSNILNLSSVYSIRLYELMKKWQHLGRWECSLEDLRGFLGTKSIKSYSAYGNFKNRALFPAVTEVNEKTDIHIDFKEIKKGRAVDRIEFTIQHFEEKEIRLPKPKKDKAEGFDLLKEMNKKTNRDGKRYTISNEAFNTLHTIATEIYSTGTVNQELLALVNYVNRMPGNLKSPIGMMISILREKKSVYENGGNPSIEQMEIFEDEGKPLIPDWFQNRDNSGEKEFDPELEERRKKLQKELEEMNEKRKN